jgi:hypothetical protein
MKRRQVIKAICQVTVGAATAAVAGTALARVGRPMTPGSVAGVRRRTRRRTRRRMYYMSAGMTIYGLPYGCGGMRPYGGINMYYCGGIYYRPVHQGTTVVYVVDRVDPGANTQVQIEEYY